jgi:hypothetical protein
MKVLASVSALVKLAVICFLIGLACGFWFAGRVSSAVNSGVTSSTIGMHADPLPRAVGGQPEAVSGWRGGGRA